MARTNNLIRRSRQFETPRGARYSLRLFEKKILKYYPKHFRIFENSQLSQDDRFWNYNRDYPKMELAEDYSPHQRILRKYRADFFQSLKVFYESKSPRPTKIPHNIRHLSIVEGSRIFLKKLIKQNKGLKHITLDPDSWTVRKMVKYSKGLCSIRFEDTQPFFSEEMCQKMLRNWKNKMQKVEILGNYFQDPQSLRRFLKTLLQFPSLKEFRFLGKAFDGLKHFLLAKLQEKNIAYDVRFSIEENTLRSQQSEFKSIDCLIISYPDFEYKNDETGRKDWKIQDLSQKTLRLDHLPSSSFIGRLLPLFQNVSSLDLSSTGKKSDYSALGPLNNLKHLTLDISTTDYLKDFLCYFHENVAQSAKLETVFIKGNLTSRIRKENTSDLVHLFKTCSKTLRKASFEFKSDRIPDDYFEFLCEVFSQLINLQSLSVFLCIEDLESVEQIERLGEIISEMESLEELNFKIKDARFDEQKVSLTLPSQLKKLSIGRDTCNSLIDLAKILAPLSSLVYLELESDRFDSKKWSKSLDKLKYLEVLVLKEVEKSSNEGRILGMKPRLDRLMKEFLSLKLIVFTNTRSRGTIILRRNYPWPEIEKMCNELSLEKPLKMSYIKSYS